jgi:hypothetical protein
MERIREIISKVLTQYKTNNISEDETEIDDDVLSKQQEFMDIYKNDKRSFVRKYGKDAEKVMYGTSMKKAKNS